MHGENTKKFQHNLNLFLVTNLEHFIKEINWSVGWPKGEKPTKDRDEN